MSLKSLVMLGNCAIDFDLIYCVRITNRSNGLQFPVNRLSVYANFSPLTGDSDKVVSEIHVMDDNAASLWKRVESDNRFEKFDQTGGMNHIALDISRVCGLVLDPKSATGTIVFSLTETRQTQIGFPGDIIRSILEKTFGK